MIPRERHEDRVRALLGRHPVVGLLGARQVGKTTLARAVAGSDGSPTSWFDLENPDDLARLDEPTLALAGREGLVVLDEVQRRPDLFPILRVITDDPGNRSRFLVTGSASPDLLRQSSESLAGRIIYHELSGFALDEVGFANRDRLWLRGGFPRSYLAASDDASFEWRNAFVGTFLERDIPSLGIRVPSITLRRFWQMLAHYHAQVWNGSELARAFGVAHTTVRRYLDILTSALVLRQLRPWHENVGKRQVKSPKVYVADSGLLHLLLDLRTPRDLEGHPKVGASWEGFVLGELIAHLGLDPHEMYFWGTHAGAELDLLVLRGNRRLGFEMKRTTRPATTRSMRSAIETLGLDELYVIHAGEESFALPEGARAVALSDLVTEVSPR